MTDEKKMEESLYANEKAKEAGELPLPPAYSYYSLDENDSLPYLPRSIPTLPLRNNDHILYTYGNEFRLVRPLQPAKFHLFMGKVIKATCVLCFGVALYLFVRGVVKGE